MGLDIVEFVMSVEEKFELEISDEHKTRFVNPRAVIDYVFSEVQNNYSRKEIADEIWRILIYETGIDRSQFDEDSRFIEDMGLD